MSAAAVNRFVAPIDQYECVLTLPPLEDPPFRNSQRGVMEAITIRLLLVRQLKRTTPGHIMKKYRISKHGQSRFQQPKPASTVNAMNLPRAAHQNP